jgi:hypothetical protein
VIGGSRLGAALGGLGQRFPWDLSGGEGWRLGVSVVLNDSAPDSHPGLASCSKETRFPGSHARKTWTARHGWTIIEIARHVGRGPQTVRTT